MKTVGRGGGPEGSPVPRLAALALHRDAGGIADFDPDATGARSIRAIDLLRNDTLGTEPAKTVGSSEVFV